MVPTSIDVQAQGDIIAGVVDVVLGVVVIGLAVRSYARSRDAKPTPAELLDSPTDSGDRLR